MITVMPGGQINPAADNGGETLDLHGALLVNDGAINGTTNVYFGSLAEGTGSYGPMHVFEGGSFAPGNSPGKVVVSGSLALDPGATLDFDLDAVADSGLVLMPGNLLTLGGQDLSSMSFTVEPGFGKGTYTLIAAQEVSGSIGTSDSGTIDGLPATLSMEGSNLVLTVVPEPSTLALLVAGAIGWLGNAWRIYLARTSCQRPC